MEKIVRPFYTRISVSSVKLPDDLKRLLQTVKAGKIRRELGALASTSRGSHPGVSIMSDDDLKTPRFSTFKEYYASLRKQREDNIKAGKGAEGLMEKEKKTVQENEYNAVSSFEHTSAAKALRREYKRNKKNKTMKAMSRGIGIITEGDNKTKFIQMEPESAPHPNRKGKSVMLPPAYGPEEAEAYAKMRMPKVFGANTRALAEATAKCEKFSPRSMLDFGSGPGTSIWAAQALFPSVKKVDAVEPSVTMTDVAQRLFKGEGRFGDIQWFPMLRADRESYYDLITSSYTLTEIPTDRSRNFILDQLWRQLRPGGIMVFVEPGTPVGFDMIRRAREYLLYYYGPESSDVQNKRSKMEASVTAPCLHNSGCPLPEGVWCHFDQKIPALPLHSLVGPPSKGASTARVRDEGAGNSNMEEEEGDEDEFEGVSKKARQPKRLRKQLKGMTRGYLSEKFSFVALQKSQAKGSIEEEEDEISKDARILFPPMVRKGHVTMDLCCEDGVARRVTVSKSFGKHFAHDLIESSLEESMVEELKEDLNNTNMSGGSVEEALEVDDDLGGEEHDHEEEELNDDEYSEMSKIVNSYNAYRQARKARWGDVFKVPKGLIAASTGSRLSSTNDEGTPDRS